jgi:uncharacterized tellurite resistance protein B-like protein
MLDRFKKIFAADTPLAAPQFTPDASHLAAAVLLAYASQIDGDEAASEQALLHHLGQSAFGLSADEAHALVVLAKQKAAESTDLHNWTRQINQYFEQDHKMHLMECLWSVVDADGEVTDFEASLLQRIAGLIYLSPKDNALARQAARSQAES